MFSQSTIKLNLIKKRFNKFYKNYENIYFHVIIKQNTQLFKT